MKKYMKVYTHFRNLIENGTLNENDRLPSIRKACQMTGMSKTTVENAYFMLQADGFIIAREKSGYYVKTSSIESVRKDFKDENSEKILFDLKSDVSNEADFDFDLWRRYMRNALRQKERFITYSSVQGEKDLREALCDYVRKKRNIITDPDRIVVAAGIYPLMQMLLSLLKDRKTFSFPDSSYVQGIATAKDLGFDVRTRYKDADIIYVCPSHMNVSGDVMPVKRRLELVRYSAQRNSLVLEDDFDNDFLYPRKPAPSLFAMKESDNVIYMGSFSSLLIPGIRISFMILNDEMNERFLENSYRFSQTASKAEQIALCGFIRDGHIYSKTRKTRRKYRQKTDSLLEMTRERIPGIDASLGENGLQIIIRTEKNLTQSDFMKKGISLYVQKKEEHTEIVLFPSPLCEDDFDEITGLIAEIIEGA